MGITRHGNVLSWGSDVEDNTIAQAEQAARLPFIHRHVALMPDAHVGKGSTVGSVIATNGAIVPAAVGVDIGCGMIAVDTRLTSHALPDDLGPLHDLIRTAVPAGLGKGHESRRPRPGLKHWPWDRKTGTDLSDKQQHTASDQFGTLGSGNHFVEVCLDECDHVWVVLHSGSRGIGNQLATQHIECARGLMKRYFIELEDKDLAYLVEGTPEFDAYIQAMLWAQAYAAGNRETMMDAVLAALASVTAYEGYYTSNDPASTPLEAQRINCHHNYTELEHHDDANVWVTRKGAIRARTGDLGIIPGSMGTNTYIVSGLGNPLSFNSCAHGAGRRLSRGQARKTLDLDGLRAQMAGKVWNDRDAEALLDEDPRSYKDIDRVMADQADLCRIEHTLTQVLNFKGA